MQSEQQFIRRTRFSNQRQIFSSLEIELDEELEVRSEPSHRFGLAGLASAAQDQWLSGLGLTPLEEHRIDAAREIHTIIGS